MKKTKVVEDGIFTLWSPLKKWKMEYLLYGVQFQCIIMDKTKIVEEGIFTLGGIILST